jgi:hypothetical protein
MVAAPRPPTCLRVRPPRGSRRAQTKSELPAAHSDGWRCCARRSHRKHLTSLPRDTNPLRTLQVSAARLKSCQAGLPRRPSSSGQVSSLQTAAAHSSLNIQNDIERGARDWLHRRPPDAGALQRSRLRGREICICREGMWKLDLVEVRRPMTRSFNVTILPQLI